MSEKKTTIRQNENSRFFIVNRNGEDEKFFGGFYNETECPGTENESFCWEMEHWVDRPEDGAMMFKTLHEARDFKDYLEDSARARMEVDVARREVERLNREISELRDKLAGK